MFGSLKKAELVVIALVAYFVVTKFPNVAIMA
jgi:hypothetical protein